MLLNNVDNKYKNIVNDILSNEEFNRLKDYSHHGKDRYSHLIRVSYISYKISRVLGFNYESVARGGLLHDFYMESNDLDPLNRGKLLRNHANYAYNNSIKYFSLNCIEEDIIKTHMFPVTSSPPKFIESWLVDIVDDIVSVYERCNNVSKKVVAVSNALVILYLSVFK